MSKDRNTSTHDKRVIKLIVGAVVITAVILGALLWVTRAPSAEEPGKINSNVPLSASGKIASEATSKEFIKSSGNFGVKGSELTGDNIRNISYLLRTNDASNSKYVTTRKDSYNFLKTYIYKGSPIDYDSRVVAQWQSPDEARNLTTYEASNVVAKARDNAQILTIDGKETTAAQVDVTFDSKETIRVVTANDTSWDGSYSVLEKNFSRNTVTLLLAQDGEQWKVYAQSNLQNQFLLSTWQTPDSNAYADAQSGFTQVSTLKLTEPLKEPKQ